MNDEVNANAFVFTSSFIVHRSSLIVMLKLLLCIIFSAILGATLIELRQQRLELSFQTNGLHSQIEHSQGKLWNQQLQIAIYTAPNAIQETVGRKDLNMVPQTPMPAVKSSWIDASSDPAAE